MTAAPNPADNSGVRTFVLDTSVLLDELGGDDFELDEQLWYPVKNRHMSYGRHNGANIDREYVLLFRRRAQRDPRSPRSRFAPLRHARPAPKP